jgi:hypothetical protein
VSEAADQGYFSAQTLAGGRIRSELKDVATSVQIVTELMLEDLGATNLNDVFAYTTNTDAVGSMSTFTTASDSFGDGSLDQSAARLDQSEQGHHSKKNGNSCGRDGRRKGVHAKARSFRYFEAVRRHNVKALRQTSDHF